MVIRGSQFAMNKGDFSRRQGQQDGELLLLKSTLCCGHLWERLVNSSTALGKRESYDPSSEFDLLQGLEMFGNDLMLSRFIEVWPLLLVSPALLKGKGSWEESHYLNILFQNVAGS